MPITFYDRNLTEGVEFQESLDEPMEFPAGEQHIRDAEDSYDIEVISPTCFFYLTGTDANDYISAAMWTDLQRQRGRSVAGLIPYLPGARQDRGRPFGAEIYANLINNINADQVITFDPHSPVMPEMISHITVVDSTAAILKGLSDHALTGQLGGIIAPDKGAHDRAARVAKALDLPVYTAGKKRNPATGHLTDFTCEPIPDDGTIKLVVDDICDGGRTFLGLADSTGLPPEQLALWVSHGVFSGNHGNLLRQRYDHIFTTNSHPGYRNTAVRAWVVPIFRHLYEEISL